ncbi:MAG TPA: AarF/ABC1/UbiB kinase family protein [Myxococcota bacterium]|nr:AarF/ABC1/UbiB kinase family protein [Myxococcota bacterium]HRY93649.1 AarF/ABC1/UbiB kinase family protein [Myxococcota bacterium]HSA23100.1 AarF/ABC1/UbiB kinase family protein [Myxococcota bacterium]
MADPKDDRLERFTAELRDAPAPGPGAGLGRFARLLRGGLGLARSVAGRKSDEGPTEKDLAKIEALVTRLGALKGLPMKMGQIMSYLELDLPEESRRLLCLLQTQSPATAFARVEAILREDLGERAEPLLAGLERTPASVASIGQVHRGRLPDGEDVAVKVRHPDIEAAIRSDFRSARVGTMFAAALMPGMGATAKDFVAELEARLLEECDYALEATRQERFAGLYAGHPVIVVPAVRRDFSGPRVLTSAWEQGEDLEAFQARASQAERDRAGAALFELYIGTLYRHGLFHADPHPGNYRFRPDGRVVVFDYGCVREFEPEVAAAFVALAEAMRDDDRARITAALRGLGAEPSANDAAYAHLRGLLRSFFGPMLVSGPHRIEGRIVVDARRMMRDKLAIARLRLPGRLMFLFRIRFGLFAVLSRLGSVNDWAALERGFARQIGPGTAI